MSQFNQNGSDYDSEGLPPSVRRVERERLRLSVDLSEYLVFFIDESTFQNDFVNPNAEGIRGIRCTFNPQTNTLIAKMITPEHHQVVKAFDEAIDSALAPMGLHRATFSYGEVNIDINGRSKQPDWGLGPRHPPPGTRRRPAVVVEIAISQTRRRLQRDIDLWLDPSRGNTNVAIAIKANRTRPFITIDKYGWDHGNGQAQISQHIEIRESDTGDQVSVSGAPLTIPFDLLFLRPPQPPREETKTVPEFHQRERVELTSSRFHLHQWTMTADLADHELSPRTRSGSASSSHKRSVSSSLLSRISFLRVNQTAHTSIDRHHTDMDHDGDEDLHSDIPQNTGKGGTTSSRAMSAALAQHRTRRRRGSLRKTALLGTRLESRDKRATAKAAEAIEALRAEPSRLPAADLQAAIQPKDQTPSNNGTTQYSPRESVALDDDRDDTQQPTWFRAANTQIPTRPSISRRRQGLAQHNLQEQATDDEDLVSFPPLHSNSTPTAAGTSTSPKIISAGLHISPPSSSSGSFYSLQPQPEPAYLPVHRHKSSPLVTHPVEMKSSPDVDIDYSETEWWGWIILIVTWLVFVVGIGSCFEVWSWAWDVGETPYAPPELEDDPTLPIVGYYPALIILTAVMSWVWVVVAWVGMKYFKHANISGEDI
ncbi:unnamed protein product [Penicillium palitans]